MSDIRYEIHADAPDRGWQDVTIKVPGLGLVRASAGDGVLDAPSFEWSDEGPETVRRLLAGETFPPEPRPLLSAEDVTDALTELAEICNTHGEDFIELAKTANGRMQDAHDS